MTAIRLTAAQKASLERVARVLGALMGRRLTHGAVEALADFAERNRELLLKSNLGAGELGGDPFYDMSIVFDIGPTDERTHDRETYGRG